MFGLRETLEIDQTGRIFDSDLARVEASFTKILDRDLNGLFEWSFSLVARTLQHHCLSEIAEAHGQPGVLLTPEDENCPFEVFTGGGGIALGQVAVAAAQQGDR